MLNSVTLCRGAVILRPLDIYVNRSHGHHSNMALLLRSWSFSTSSRRIYSYHLRKRRKWPHSPYKAKWHETFNHQQAMETLKQSTATSTHLLSALINSFTIYNCDPTPNAYHFVIKTLTQTSQFHQLHPVLDRLQNVEKFETPEYIFVELIKIYGNANMTQHAIDLFFRIPNFRCTPSVYSLNSLLSVLCKRREDLRIVPQILLKSSQSMNIRLEESSFHTLIKALCRKRKVNYAIKLLNYMIQDGFSVDGRIFSIILSTLCEQEDLYGVEVMNFLEEMRKLGFCADSVDWCNVIRFLVKKGKGMDALDALNQMKMDRIKPDVICYTMVLDGVIAEGKYTMVDELFDEMLILGLVPDIYTYNVYINGLCKQNKVEDGIKMLVCMEELGCKPDLITFNTLLEGFCRVGQLSRARGLVREMELKGIQLNSLTYEIMIDGLVRVGDFDEACCLLRKMLDMCLVPQSSTYDELICGLCRSGLVCNALELLKDIVGKNVAPGFGAWEALVLGSGIKPGFKEIALMNSANQIQTEFLELPVH